DPSPAILQMVREASVVLSMLAEMVLRRLPDLSSEAMDQVVAEARRRPWRWLAPCRRALLMERAGDKIRPATLLEAVGEREDIQRLHKAGKGSRDRRAAKLALTLARRLADRVWVEDLGRVRIVSGVQTIEGSEIRRKVLAL